MRAWECKPKRPANCGPGRHSIRASRTLRRWPAAWPAGSRAALLALWLLILPSAAAAQAVSADDIARAVDGFVSALSSGTVGSLGAIESVEARELLISSVCVNVHSFRARTKTVNEHGATVILDLMASRVLRSTSQTTESLPDRWVLTIACGDGGCRVKRAVTNADAVAIAIVDARESERESILAAEAPGEEAEVARWLSRHSVDLTWGGRVEYERAAGLVRFARQLAVRSSDPAVEAYTVLLLAGVHHNQRTPWLEECTEALELARMSGDADTIAEILSYLGRWKWQEHDAGGLEDLRIAAAMTAELRDPRFGLYALEALCLAQIQNGDLRVALRTANELRERSASFGWTEGESIGARRGATVYYVLQDYETARRYNEIAWQKAFASHDVRLQGYAMHNMATTDLQARRFDQAIEEFRRAAAMMAGLSDDELMTAYASLANGLIEAGRYREAGAAVESALAHGGNIEPICRARTMTILSELRLAQGRPAEALAAAISALPPQDAPKEGLSGFSPWHAQTAAGRALKRLGRLADAEARLRRAVEIIEEERSRFEGAAVHYFEGKTVPYEELTGILVASGRAREALEFSERLRARTLAMIAEQGRVDVSAVMTAAEKARQRELDGKLAELNRLLARKSEGVEARSLATDRDAVRVDLQRFRAELDVVHPMRRPPPEKPLTIPPALGDTLFVEYLVGDDGVAIFAVRRGSGGAIRATARYVSISRPRLEALAARFVHSIEQRDLGYTGDARRLYDLLLHPVESELRSSRRLCVIPDGVLWRLPFHVFVDPAGRHVLERMPLFYSPSIRTLSITTRPPADDEPLGQLLAFGNPALSPAMTRQAVAFQRDASVGPLPQAEEEVETIRRLYGTKDVKVLVGAAASEATFKDEAARYRILHIAAHGVFDERAPMFSALLLAARDGGTEDGFLEAREIADLALRADVVILSACDSARGRYGAGEGLIGMTWALQVAGCPTAVVSQWKAASAPTADLMIAFHRALLSGASKPDALRRAALQLLNDRRTAHPFYWAPFIVVGQP
ncbi:MAG TPA: CHAT domain-containing protein [Thermoanaerobaculia bacterium]|nr:CHAT domain-containing protein [Thermoanaerobaculia bacterium]